VRLQIAAIFLVRCIRLTECGCCPLYTLDHGSLKATNLG
jgi:hypothetical protein